VTVSKIVVVLSLIMFGCGKVQQMQDSVSNMIVSNDVRGVEVLEAKLHRAPTKDNSYLEYAQVQYKIGTLTVDAQQTWDAIPLNQTVDVYFKGPFVSRSGFSPDPSVNYQAVDFELLKRK
jgi:hypothetical protein